jgi:hypothetical protein
MKQPWRKAGIEPALRDVFADPIVKSLMRGADHITRRDVLLASERTLDRAIEPDAVAKVA